ncbi:unnamed protein product [Closterium sp. NIES-65]|nr:unnamed protein product [Closterium sp. NIES-65]
MEEAAMPEAGVAVDPAERGGGSALFEAEATRRTGAITGGDCTSHSPFEEPNAGASPPAASSLSPDSIREPAHPEAECQFAGNGAIGGGVGSVGAPCAAVSPDGAPNDDAVPPTSRISPDTVQPVPIDPLPHPKLKNQWREAKAEASRWWLLGERQLSCVSLTRGAKVEAFDPVDFHFPKGEASGGGEGSGHVGGKQGGKDGGRARGRPPKWSKTLSRVSSAGSSIVRFGTKRGGEVGSLPREWAAALIPLEAEGKVRLRGYVCSAPPCLAMFSEILLTVRVYVQQCCFQKLTRVKERAAHALSVCTAAHITRLLRFLELRPTRPAEFTPADFNHHTEKLGFTFAFADRQAATKRVRATAGGGESNEGGEEEAKSMTDEEVNRYVGVTTNNQALPEMEPPPGVTSQLRCYQKQALHWMLSMEALGRGSLCQDLISSHPFPPCHPSHASCQEMEPPPGVTSQLRCYQKQALHWMLSMEALGRGSLCQDLISLHPFPPCHPSHASCQEMEPPPGVTSQLRCYQKQALHWMLSMEALGRGSLCQDLISSHPFPPCHPSHASCQEMEPPPGVTSQLRCCQKQALHWMLSMEALGRGSLCQDLISSHPFPPCHPSHASCQEMEPPPGVTSQLRCYQKQALHWMLSMEALGRGSLCQDLISSHPFPPCQPSHASCQEMEPPPGVTSQLRCYQKQALHWMLSMEALGQAVPGIGELVPGNGQAVPGNAATAEVSTSLCPGAADASGTAAAAAAAAAADGGGGAGGGKRTSAVNECDALHPCWEEYTLQHKCAALRVFQMHHSGLFFRFSLCIHRCAPSLNPSPRSPLNPFILLLPLPSPSPSPHLNSLRTHIHLVSLTLLPPPSQWRHAVLPQRFLRGSYPGVSKRNGEKQGRGEWEEAEDIEGVRGLLRTYPFRYPPPPFPPLSLDFPHFIQSLAGTMGLCYTGMDRYTGLNSSFPVPPLFPFLPHLSRLPLVQILADAMGLGKTVMTIALIAASKANRERGKAMATGTRGKLGGVVGKMDGGGSGKQVRDERRGGNINGECAVSNGADCKQDEEAAGGVKRKRGECSAVAGEGRGVRVGSRRKKRVKREAGEGVMGEGEGGTGEGGDVWFSDQDEDEEEDEDEDKDKDKDGDYLPGEEGGDIGADAGGSDSDAEVQEVGGDTWRAEETPEEMQAEGGREVEEWNGRGGNSSRDRRVQGGTLIVCPMSLLSQWKAECEAHTAPGVLSVMVYYGSQRRDFEARYLAKHDVVITTYGTLQAEYKKFNKKAAEDSVAAQQVPLPAEFLTSACTPPPSRFNPPPPPPSPVRQGPLHSVQWCRAVLDEAHFIKNRVSGAAAATFALQADARWCLTGTPIQNQLEDVYSLLRFLRVQPWDNWGWWQRLVQQPYERGDMRSIKLLQGLLKPLMLRRTKDSKDRNGQPILVLPPISFHVISCEFSAEERDFYDALHNKSKVKFDSFVAQGRVLHNYASILEMLLRLRQVCDHPFLVLSRSDTMDDEDLSKLGRKFLAASSQGTAGSAAAAAAASAAGAGGTTTTADAAATGAGAWGEAGSSCPIGWDHGDETHESHKGPSREYVQSVMEQLKRRREGLMQGGDECPVCLEAAEDAVFMPCAHIACRECLLTAWRPSVNGPCPVCRLPILRSQLITVPRASRFSLDVEASWQDSVKVRQLLQCLGEIRAASAWKGANGGGGGEKSVVFSQWTAFLDLLEIAFKRAKVLYVRLDGSMSQQQRERAINEFRENPKVEVLLVSLKAGGVGLNLTAASHAFVMDPWWNPSVEEQAVMRVHRIGQTRPVTVTRFIVRDSVEERMQKVQLRKDQMVQGALMDDGARSARINELKMLFR